MRKASLVISTLTTSALLLPTALAGQTPSHDPSTTLQRVLPPNIAQQVLAEIADARSHSLPAVVLEHRAFELQAKGTPPARIPEMIASTEQALVAGKAALAAGGRTETADAEIEAAGTATGHGVDGGTISTLAELVPSGRSLVVPLTVLTSLVDRGLPSDEALARVVARLQAHASDQELTTLATTENGSQHGASGQAPGNGNRPDQPGPPGSTPAGTTPSGVTPPVGPPSSLPGPGRPPITVPTTPGKGHRHSDPGHP